MSRRYALLRAAFFDASRAACLCCAAANAYAQTPGRVAVAVGDDPYGGDTRVVRLTLAWDWRDAWVRNDLTLRPYWALTAGHWDSRAGAARASNLNDVGARIGARLTRERSLVDHAHLYFDASTGVHYLTETGIQNRNFSLHVQFGTELGIGVTFGRQHRFDLGWRFMHFSNAQIKEPNSGINLNFIEFGYRF